MSETLLREIVVIGAGVMGCQLAYALSKQHQVTLLEAGAIGQQGASSLPLALLNPLRGRSARMQPLDFAGLQAVNKLESAITHDALYQTGVLRIASNARQAKTWRKRQQSYAELLELTWLESNDVPSNYHAPFGALLIHEAGYVVPERFLKNLAQAVHDNGGEVMEKTRVLSINHDTIHTNTRAIQAKHIFLCVGADPQGLALAAPTTKDLMRMAGEIISVHSDVPLDYPVAGAVYAAQHQGKICIGGNHRMLINNTMAHDDTTHNKAAHSKTSHNKTSYGAPSHGENSERLQQSMAWFIPTLRQTRPYHIWSGVRCKTADAMPRVVSITPHLHFIGAMAGRGFLCSAYLAQQLAKTL